MKLISFTSKVNTQTANELPITKQTLMLDKRFKGATISDETITLLNDLIQIYIKRDPRRLDVTEKWLMSGENELLLRVYPVDSMTVTMSLGTEDLRNVTDYEVNEEISRVFFDSHLCGKLLVVYTTKTIRQATQAMRIAGRQLLANIIGLQCDTKRADVDAISIAGIGSVNYDSPAVFTPDVKQLLYPYRVKSL